MLYTEFNVNGIEYKLRLRTRDIITLEKQIGVNPLAIFGAGDTIPTIGTMAQILHASLQAYQSNITLDKAYDIFDAWIAEGNALVDFIPIILDIYKTSGLIRKDNAEKN